MSRKSPAVREVVQLDMQLGRESRMDDAMIVARRFRHSAKMLRLYGDCHREVEAGRQMHRALLEGAVDCVRAARSLRDYSRCRWCREVFTEETPIAVCAKCRSRIWSNYPFTELSEHGKGQK